MTNINIPDDDDIRELIRQIALKQYTTQDQILETQTQLQELASDTTRVLARSAILDDVLLELRENQEILQRNFERHQQNFERHQQNFEEHQRTTNAALNSLEAILLRLTRNEN